MNTLLDGDAGLVLILFIDMETTKRLYSMYPYFKSLLNSQRVIEHLKRVNIILPPVCSYPEYCCQHIIKYGGKDSPFNEYFTESTAIRNDDIEALLLTDNGYNTYSFTRAILTDKKNIVSYMIRQSRFKVFTDAYNGIINYNNFNDIFDVIWGLLCGKKYEQVLNFISDVLPCYNVGVRYGVKTYVMYVSEQHEYEKCMMLIEKCVSIPELQGLKKYAYERCCTVFALKDRKNDIQKMITDQILTLEDIKNISVKFCWSDVGMSQEIYEMIDYYIPQYVNGCLNGIICECDQRPAQEGECYINSNIGMVGGLHNKNPNLKISIRAYNQAIKSKDLLTIDYINKNKIGVV
jgi:hypothetical protein